MECGQGSSEAAEARSVLVFQSYNKVLNRTRFIKTNAIPHLVYK